LAEQGINSVLQGRRIPCSREKQGTFVVVDRTATNLGLLHFDAGWASLGGRSATREILS
jgi:hypothetical protein